MIYLNASDYLNYGDLAKILDTLRKQEIENIGLWVTSAANKDFISTLKVKIPPEPKVEETLDSPDSETKRTFLNLQKDGKISFGMYDKDFGFKPDKQEIKEEELEAKIAALFKEREEKKIYRQGTTEVDKRIYIKPTKSNNYGQIARMVDAATGAGATVYLQIDDLAE